MKSPAKEIILINLGVNGHVALKALSAKAAHAQRAAECEASMKAERAQLGMAAATRRREEIMEARVSLQARLAPTHTFTPALTPNLTLTPTLTLALTPTLTLTPAFTISLPLHRHPQTTPLSLLQAKLAPTKETTPRPRRTTPRL